MHACTHWDSNDLYRELLCGYGQAAEADRAQKLQK